MLYTVRYDQIPSANCPLSSSLTRAHSLLPTESPSYFHAFPPSLPSFFLQPTPFFSKSCASGHSCCVFMTTMVTAYTEALHSTTPNPPDPTDFPQPLLWYSLYTGGGDIDIPLGLSIQQPLIHRTFDHLWVPVLTALQRQKASLTKAETALDHGYKYKFYLSIYQTSVADSSTRPVTS